MLSLIVAAEPDGVQTLLLFVPFLVTVVLPVTIAVMLVRRARRRRAQETPTPRRPDE